MATILPGSRTLQGSSFARIDGLAQLEANLKILREEFGVKTGGIIIRGLRAGAKLIRDEARSRVPHVPSGYVRALNAALAARAKGTQRRGRRARFSNAEGLLRSSIVEHAIPVKARLANGQPTVLVRVRNHGYERLNGAIRFNRPGSSAGWWWWLEFGTSRRGAQPFLRPAFESQKVAAADAFKKHVRAEIDRLFSQHYRIAA